MPRQSPWATVAPVTSVNGCRKRTASHVSSGHAGHGADQCWSVKQLPSVQSCFHMSKEDVPFPGSLRHLGV